MTTFKLINRTDLKPEQGTAWVAGFNGGGANGLQPTGKGGGSFSASTQAFYQIGSGDNQIDTITLNSGGGRLIFVVSLAQPATLPVGQGSYTPAPYPTAPATLPAGPQDFFEFSYNGNDDLTAVQGFSLNMYFTLNDTESYGVDVEISRDEIGTAYLTFMQNDPEGAAYVNLLYPSTSYPLPSGMSVPANQFLAICDPFDWITNYNCDALATYWDSTLALFFQDGNYLSINLNASGPTNIYSGQCSGGTYTLSNGTNTYTFANPGAGLAGAQYVFGQAFAQTPAPDQGLLQDNIWQALCRGVALDGVSSTQITNGESTTAWNNYAVWYTQHTSAAFPKFNAVYNTYAKFLHYSTVFGTDTRYDNRNPPMFTNSAAYGYSEDENPNGPYSGNQVPSKTVANVGPNDTVTITVGPWPATM